ncbi:hypothetical protein L3X38_002467 [Prunus dulcis]|uniref:Uncharacterized protein n=1 Tax=Prunus dulcis TaxID=3755 RepID=A0AAD4WVQ1_PRUDU|nr:hypothetical protein L3X38_002467 [Prunus dulcis]
MPCLSLGVFLDRNLNTKKKKTLIPEFIKTTQNRIVIFKSQFKFRKRKIEELTQSQRGALDRFVVRESHATIDENIFNEQEQDDVEELQDIENNMDECVGNAEQNENDDNENADIDDHNEDVEDVDIENHNNENVTDLFNEEPSQSIPLDIYDPRNWE